MQDIKLTKIRCYDNPRWRNVNDRSDGDKTLNAYSPPTAATNIKFDVQEDELLVERKNYEGESKSLCPYFFQPQ
jgi:hypothetical protein